MIIRKATENDIDAMMPVYQKAKELMDASGNPTQWKKGYPTRDMILMDIASGCSYVIEQDGEICAVFFYREWQDPTYEYIEGAWKNTFPYGVIHRVASNGKYRGVMNEIVSFCKSKCRNLKCDTHEDNKIMQHALEKHGFEKCGIIYVRDHSPRIAYQWSEA